MSSSVTDLSSTTPCTPGASTSVARRTIGARSERLSQGPRTTTARVRRLDTTTLGAKVSDWLRFFSRRYA